MPTVFDVYESLEQDVARHKAISPGFEDFKYLIKSYVEEHQVAATLGLLVNSELTYLSGTIECKADTDAIFVESYKLNLNPSSAFRVIRYKDSVQFIAEKGDTHLDLTLFFL